MEIETCKSSSIYNIQKDLEVGFDEVVSIFMMKNIKDKNVLKLIESGLDNAKRTKLKKIIGNENGVK